MPTDYLTEPDPKFAALVAATLPGMAHWAGSGPRGRACGECHFLVNLTVGNGQSTRCEKYKLMMGHFGPKRIPVTTPSCKYFEPLPPPTKTKRR